MRCALHLGLALGAASMVNAALAQDVPDSVRGAGTGLQQRAYAVAGASQQGLADGLRVSSLGGQGFVFAQAPLLMSGFRVPSGFSLADPFAAAGAPTGTALDYRLNQWTLSSSVRQGLASSRPGTARIDLSASYGFNVAPRHEIVLFGGIGFGAGSGGLQLGSDDVAARAALRPYGVGTGLRDMGMRLSWRYTLHQNFFVDTSIGYERQFGDSGDGFGSYERNVGSFGAMFGYRFY